MIFIPTVYSLFSYFLSPHLFIHLSNRNSLVLFTPFPTVVHYTKSTVPVPPRPKRNISETEIKEFLEKNGFELNYQNVSCICIKRN
jgi:hypothetical protein